MNKNRMIEILLSLVFLIVLIVLSVFFLYIKSFYSFEGVTTEKINSRIQNIDYTLDRASNAARQIAASSIQNCSDDVLTDMRTIVATTPDVRSITLSKNNFIFCSSVYGKVSIKFDQTTYHNNSLMLVHGSSLNPSESFLVFSLKDRNGISIFVGVNGYYLYDRLQGFENNSSFYIKVNDIYMNNRGKLTNELSSIDYLETKSTKYGYSIAVVNNNNDIYYMFIDYLKKYIIVIFSVSSFFSFIFYKYINYHNSIRAQLSNAVKKKELTAVIQPIFNGARNEVVGGEVLIRWFHPKHGNISPDIFIPVAEQYGLVKDILNVCFENVTSFFADSNLIIKNELLICFNVSVSNFDNDDLLCLCNKFQSDMHDKNIRIVLEITERDRFVFNNSHKKKIDQLKNIGVLFSLDDFGCGHSNLNYLSLFNPDIIKIDKSFTESIDKKAHSKNVVTYIISLARSFKCEVIAEGVENYLQLSSLKLLGVELFQGYYYSKPMPIDEFIIFILRKGKGHTTI